MFRMDDLKSKVSELKLGDIIEMGATEDDFKVPEDYERAELDRPVRVRFDAELINATGYLLKKFNCSSNMLFKSAIKLGAMLIGDKIKIIEDIWWFIEDVIYKHAQENNDVYTIHLINQYSNEMMETYIRFKPKYPRFVKDKSLYPYPKWRIVLDRFSWIIRCPKSEIYRGAISLAFSTEIIVISSREFNNWINIICHENLNTTQNFCVVFKNSTSFIKYGYGDYIYSRIKRKETLSEEVRKIIEEVIL